MYDIKNKGDFDVFVVRTEHGDEYILPYVTRRLQKYISRQWYAMAVFVGIGISFASILILAISFAKIRSSQHADDANIPEALWAIFIVSCLTLLVAPTLVSCSIFRKYVADNVSIANENIARWIHDNCRSPANEIVQWRSYTPTTSFAPPPYNDKPLRDEIARLTEQLEHENGVSNGYRLRNITLLERVAKLDELQNELTLSKEALDASAKLRAKLEAQIATLTAELEALRATPPREIVREHETRVVRANTIVIPRDEFDHFMRDEHALAIQRRSQEVFDILEGVTAVAQDSAEEPLVLDMDEITGMFTKRGASANMLQELRSLLGRLKAHSHTMG